MAARAYLLDLVGCIIFADKSATSVSLFYLGFFVDLRLTGGYSWASATSTQMYEQLGDCSYTNTKQLAGYATLLQEWIYENFPSIGMRRMQALYYEDQPWCKMYDAGKVTSIVVVRSQLDTLTLASIQFCPYDEHMEERPFKWISLFYGYLRLGNWTQLHMPKRVLR
ncbi:protein MAIN-LIKE 1-like [Phaseolus vulgaris]|uniref:protein MAIN-LIKE 1-like n=1 Tax=Phaseolus vulgaris TaxID=3885 RepID=UPI0035CB217C